MGAFVYQRRNGVRPGADACEAACKRHACDLQQCLARLPVSAATARMDVNVCNVFMVKWDKCCDAVKAAAAARDAAATAATQPEAAAKG